MVWLVQAGLGWGNSLQAAVQQHLAPNYRLGWRHYIYSGAQSWWGNSCLEEVLMVGHGYTKIAALQASVIPHPLIFSLAKPKVKGQNVYCNHPCYEAIARALMNTLFECCEELRTVILFSTEVIKSPHINHFFILCLLLVFSSFPGNVCTPANRWAKLPRGQNDPPKWRRTNFSFGRFCPICHVSSYLHDWKGTQIRKITE